MKYKIVEMVTPYNYNVHLKKEIDNAPEYYQEMKAKHPDAIILYRKGDFYEAYCEDAQIVADVVGIYVTTNTNRTYRKAGFPHHALDIYLPKLVRAGYRIAICDEI